MNTNAFVRILLTVVGLPLLVLVTSLDFAFYLPMVLVVLFFSCFGAIETAALLRSKGLVVNPWLPAVLGLFLPLLAYAENLGAIKADVSILITALVMTGIFVRQIFVNSEENLQPVLGKITSILFVMVYPGMFMYFIVKMAVFANEGPFFALFTLATFGNDALAWVFGTLWGKNSPKPLFVSPKKSLIGFLGGILGTVSAFVGFNLLYPGLLGQHWLVILGFALLLSFTTIVGDLFESSLKRSAGVKDSGSLVPGRGGVLDSIDSLLFSAVVFYFFLAFGRF